MEREALEKYAEVHFDELLSLVKSLCAIPAPSHHEEKRAAFCKEWLESFGVENVYIDEAKNAVFPLRDTGRDAVLFMAHTDTVFPDTQPMPLYEKDGKLFCPGVGDDTVNVAAMLMAARYMWQSGKTPKYDIIFAANACEEGLGNLKGSRALMERYGSRVKEVISFDLNMDRIYVKAVGSARYKIKLKTAGGHSWNDFGAKNAIAEAAELVHALYGQELPKADGRTTYNVGIVSGGTSVNTIAQYAEFCYEYRSESATAMEKMKENFERILAAWKKDGVEAEVEVLGVRPGMGVCRDEAAQNALYERAERVTESVTGIKPARRSGSTDCNVPFSMGIPAVCLGLTDGDGAHTREEYIKIDSIVAGLKVALLFISEYFEA